jgi:myo-inositol-1(or 4)-monophosphatase
MESAHRVHCVDDAEVALAAAEAGAQVVRARFGGPLSRVDKGGGDFATDVDVESERVIIEQLLANRPSDHIIAEEAGHLGVSGADRCWFIDPLCGTLNYAAGTGPVAVNVALCDHDELTAAAVTDPLADVTLWTDGTTARRRRLGQETRLVPSASSHIVDLNLDAPFPNGSWFTTAALLAESEFSARFRPRVVSTSLALAWVASGQRAAYVTDGNLRDSVHFAAGIAVCLAAGCVLTNLEGGPIHTGGGGLIAAADSATHEALLALISRQLVRRI